MREEGRASRRGCSRREKYKNTMQMHVFFKPGDPYNKNKKWRSSRHVEINSTWHDDRHFLIGSTSAAGDCHQNGKHRGGQLSSCQKKDPHFVHGLSVCLFFQELQKFRPPARKKGGKLWAGPPTVTPHFSSYSHFFVLLCPAILGFSFHALRKKASFAKLKVSFSTKI